jgi:hypothetical protein
MIGRPGVHVASGIEDVSRTVSALLNEDARLESEILGLVSV